MKHTENKHTSGPWKIGVRQPTSDKFIYGKGGVEIADCDQKTNFQDENLANARLIAAAPDLLAALEDLLSFVEAQEYRFNKANKPAFYDLVNPARAAIIKATGNA